MAAPPQQQNDAPQIPTWADVFSDALRNAGLGQKDFATRFGINPSTVSRWVSGEGVPSDADVVIEIAHMIAPDRTAEMLAAAGMRRTAALVTQAKADTAKDPMIARIRSERALPESEREAMVEGYQRAQQQTIHYFELQLAEAARRRRAERDRRTRREPPPQRAAQ